MYFQPKGYWNKFSTPFSLFLFFTFFIMFGDALMSYTTPVFLDNAIKSPLLLGLVFSFSSLTGFLFDFFAGETFGNKSVHYFLKATVITALGFPIAFLLFPQNIVGILVGLGFWGIYYETQLFSNFKVVNAMRRKEEFSEAWASISIINSIAYFLGPILASYLISIYLELSLYAAIAIFLISHLCFLQFKSLLKDHSVKAHRSISPLTELKRWIVLLKSLWPVWIISLVLIMVESFFWTIGVVYAESLKDESALAGMLMSALVLPTLIVGIFMSRYKIKNGKKRLMLLTSFVAGLILSVFNFASNVNELLVVIFMFSIFISVAFNLLWAVYEDYVSRVDEFETDLIGLEQSASSIGFIIGPIIAGWLSGEYGTKVTMSYLGIFLMITAIFGLFTIPKKIRIYHQPLKSIK